MSRIYLPDNTSPPFLYQFDLTKQEPSPPPPTLGSGILETGGEFDPVESPPSIDFYPDYIVTVIVPLIIAIVLCLLLAYVMFGRREGVYAFLYLTVSAVDATMKASFYLILPFYIFSTGKKETQGQTSKCTWSSTENDARALNPLCISLKNIE